MGIRQLGGFLALAHLWILTRTFAIAMNEQVRRLICLWYISSPENVM